MKRSLRIITLLNLFCLLAAVVNGQKVFCDNGGGSFNITPPTGCVGEAVSVTSLVANSAENVSYAYNFDRKLTSAPTSGYTDVLSHTYTTPGTYTILQFGSLNGTGFTACKDITVKETRAPEADLVACENGRVRLTIVKDNSTASYESVEINWGDGSPKQTWTLTKTLLVDHMYSPGSNAVVTIRGKYANGACENALQVTTLSTGVKPPSLAKVRIVSVEMPADGNAKVIYEGMDGITSQLLIDKGDGKWAETGVTSSDGGLQSVVIKDLNPAMIYKFRLSSRNICDNVVESPAVSSMVIQPGTLVLDEINAITWKPYPDAAMLIEYQLKRDDKVVHTTTELSYMDTDVKCGNVYKYDVVAIVQNDVRSYSAPINIEPKTAAPDVITKASVTVSAENEIEMVVLPEGPGLTSSFDLEIERKLAGSAVWNKISAPENNQLGYVDNNVNTAENSYCYRFKYTNACKLSGPEFSEPVCSILLQVEGLDLTWTKDSPLTGGIGSYDLIQTDLTSNVVSQIAIGLETAYTTDVNDKSKNWYQVKAYGATGGLVSSSNIVALVRDVILLIPDAFTPTGDGHNEVFEVKSYFTESFELSVYNRWGEIVFHTDSESVGWDGSSNGAPAPAGYYTYRVNVLDSKGRKISRNGSVLLIR
jgi:gliding motility-associated-like protein